VSLLCLSFYEFSKVEPTINGCNYMPLHSFSKRRVAEMQTGTSEGKSLSFDLRLGTLHDIIFISIRSAYQHCSELTVNLLQGSEKCLPLCLQVGEIRYKSTTEILMSTIG
jgi:hypothetical protein